MFDVHIWTCLSSSFYIAGVFYSTQSLVHLHKLRTKHRHFYSLLYKKSQTKPSFLYPLQAMVYSSIADPVNSAAFKM